MFNYSGKYNLKMKVINLTENSNVYTSNVYLIRGTHNTLSDVNTLVDVGRDPALIAAVESAPTGVGKKVEQVILTHCHYDHTEMLTAIKQRYKPKVFAFSPFVKQVDNILSDGCQIKCGDCNFTVLYIPGHSQDSICLYDPESGTFFAGDSPLLIRTSDSTYDDAFMTAFRKVAALDIKTIYFGHGPPMTENCNSNIKSSLKVLEQIKCKMK